MHTLKTILLAMGLTAVIWGAGHTAGYFVCRAAVKDLADAAGCMVQLTDDLQAIGWADGQHPRANGFLQDIIDGRGVPLSAAAEQEPVPVSRIRRFSLSRIPVLERGIPLVPGSETICISDGSSLPSLMIYLSPRTEYERLPEGDALSVTTGGKRYTVPVKGLFARPAWFDRQTGETVYEVPVGKRVRSVGDTITFTLGASMPPVMLKGVTGYGYQGGKKVYRPLMVSRAYRAGEVAFRSGTGIPLIPGTTHLVAVHRQARRIHLLYSGGRPVVTVCSDSVHNRPTLTGIRGCGTAGLWGSDNDSLFRAGLTVTDSVISLLVTAAAEERGTLYGITLEKSSPVGALLADRPQSVLEVRKERVAFTPSVQTAVSRFSWRFTRQGTGAAEADQEGLTTDMPAGPEMPLRTADGRIVIQYEKNGLTVTGAGSLRRITGIRLFMTVFFNVLAIAGVVLVYGRKRT